MRNAKCNTRHATCGTQHAQCRWQLAMEDDDEIDAHTSDEIDTSVSRKPNDDAMSALFVDRSIGQAMLRDSVLLIVLHALPREAQLRLRLACKDLCNTLSKLFSDNSTSRAICFERRLRMPATLDGACDVAGFLRRLSRRLAIESSTWLLRLDVRVEAGTTTPFRCSGVRACGADGVFAAVATTPFNIELTTSGSYAWCPPSSPPALRKDPAVANGYDAACVCRGSSRFEQQPSSGERVGSEARRHSQNDAKRYVAQSHEYARVSRHRVTCVWEGLKFAHWILRRCDRGAVAFAL